MIALNSGNNIVSILNNSIDCSNDPDKILIRFYNGNYVHTNKENAIIRLLHEFHTIRNLSWEGYNVPKEAVHVKGFDISSFALSHFNMTRNNNGNYLIILDISTSVSNPIPSSYWVYYDNYRVIDIIHIS